MTRKEKALEILETIAYVLDCALLTAFTALYACVLEKTVVKEIFNAGRRAEHHGMAYGLGIGFAIFFVMLLIPRFRHNFRWLMTFTHEFTHLFFALLFGRRLEKFHVDSKESFVLYSNSWFGRPLIQLAPYCVPVFTLMLLPWRLTTSSLSVTFLMVIDILLGLTFAFHLCCWVKQTRYSQTDISGQGAVRSTLLILSFWMIGLSLVLLTPASGVKLAISRALWEYPRDIVLNFLSLI